MTVLRRLLLILFYGVALASLVFAPVIALAVSTQFGVGNSMVTAIGVLCYILGFIYFAAPAVLVLINLGIARQLDLGRTLNGMLVAATVEAAILTLTRYSGGGGEGAPATPPKSILTLLLGDGYGYGSGLAYASSLAYLITLLLWITTVTLTFAFSISRLSHSRELADMRKASFR